jgi:hypothetical protein
MTWGKLRSTQLMISSLRTDIRNWASRMHSRDSSHFTVTSYNFTLNKIIRYRMIKQCMKKQRLHWSIHMFQISFTQLYVPRAQTFYKSNDIASLWNSIIWKKRAWQQEINHTLLVLACHADAAHVVRTKRTKGAPNLGSEQIEFTNVLVRNKPTN